MICPKLPFGLPKETGAVRLQAENSEASTRGRPEGTANFVTICRSGCQDILSGLMTHKWGGERESIMNYHFMSRVVAKCHDIGQSPRQCRGDTFRWASPPLCPLVLTCDNLGLAGSRELRKLRKRLKSAIRNF